MRADVIGTLWTEHPVRRRRRAVARASTLVLFAVTLLAFPLPAVAQTPSTITVEAHDLASGAVLPTFQLPNDPNPLLRKGFA